MSYFGGKKFDYYEIYAQLQANTELLELLLAGIDPSTQDLVTTTGGDYVIDSEGNLLKWA